MAKNTIEKAIRYLSEPEAIRSVLKESLRTQDLETENIAVSAQTVPNPDLRLNNT